MTTGPKTGSLSMPTIISTWPETIGATSTPSMRACGEVPQRAAAERVELAADVRFIRNADDDAADLGLVGDVG